MLNKSFIGLAVALLATTIGTSAMAEETETYFNRNIVMPLDVAKGEPGDILARIFAEGVKKQYGQNVEITNNPQKGGAVSIKEVMNADPDGFTFTITNISTLFSDPIGLVNKPENFTIVQDIASTPSILFTNVNSPKDYKSLENDVKKEKNKYSLITTGKGSASNLIINSMKKNHDFTVNVTAYGNTSTLASDVAAGKHQVGFACYVLAQNGIQEGKLNPIAVTSPTRLKELPNTPTFKELGFEELNMETQFGIVGPKGINDATNAKIKEMIDKVLKDPETANKIEKAGFKLIQKENLENTKKQSEEFSRIFKTL